METKQHTTLSEKEKLQEEFMAAVEEKDPLKMIRVQKKIDTIEQNQSNQSKD